MALWRKNMAIPKEQREKGGRHNIIQSSGGFYVVPQKESRTIEDCLETPETRRLAEAWPLITTPEIYVSDDARLSCKCVAVYGYGNYYEFKETKIDEYSDEFGIILSDSYKKTKSFRYVYQHGLLISTELTEHGLHGCNEVPNYDHAKFINEVVVRELKKNIQEKSRTIRVKKLTRKNDIKSK